MSTLIARILRWLGSLVWVGGATLLIAWAAGRVFTDRWHWSQYCYWLPSVLVLTAATASMPVALGVRSLARKIVTPNWLPGWRETRLAMLSAAVLLGGWVYMGVVEWRMLTPRVATGPRMFRVLHWNATSDIGNQWSARIAEQDPDLVVINPAGYQLCEELAEIYRPYGPPLYRHGFTVLSKFRVVRTGYTTLGITLGTGLDPREGDLVAHRKDHGRAMFVELDTTAKLGRRMVVWCLDLPSDVSLHRRMVTAEASKALAAFTGSVSVLGADGIWSQESTDSPGFPRPDLVVGDLNIPRGSGSLDVLMAGLSPVYDQAGRGMCGTWPYRSPFWHLDQMYVAPWLTGVEYVTLDLGGGTHRAQRGDLVLTDPSATTR